MEFQEATPPILALTPTEKTYLGMSAEARTEFPLTIHTTAVLLRAADELLARTLAHDPREAYPGLVFHAALRQQKVGGLIVSQLMNGLARYGSFETVDESSPWSSETQE